MRNQKEILHLSVTKSRNLQKGWYSCHPIIECQIWGDEVQHRHSTWFQSHRQWRKRQKTVIVWALWSKWSWIISFWIFQKCPSMVSYYCKQMLEKSLIIPINAHFAGSGSFDPEGGSSWNIMFQRKSQKTKRRKTWNQNKKRQQLAKQC